jgi:hypothetical protein
MIENVGIRRTSAFAGLGVLAALVACSDLFDDAAQCRKDADCAAFAGSKCDIDHGVCIADDGDGGVPVPVGDATGGPPPPPGEAGPCGATTSDPKNCGRCGHDCLGGACANSACQPVTLASGQNLPAYLALDNANVFWTNSGDGTIRSVPIAGGSPRLVATGAVPRVWVVAVTPDVVVWTENGGTRVAGVPRDGGSSYPIATAQDAPRGITTDGVRVYWTNEGPDAGFVESAKLDGTDPQVLTGQQGSSKDIAVANGWLYWANADDGTIARMQTDGGGAGVVASAQPNAFGLALSNDSLYWTTHVDGGVIAHAKTDGTGLTTLATGQASPRAIAVDATHAYWTNQNDGTIRRAAFAGGAPEIVASGQGSPWGIAVDAASVYWAARDTGTVMKLAK